MRILILLITIIFLGALAWDVVPALRGGGGWQWAYELPVVWDGVWILAMLLAGYLLSVGIFRRIKAGVMLTIAWTIITTVILGISVVGVRGDAGFLLFTRTVSPVQTGASTIAVNYMARDGVLYTLQNWTTVMREALPANIIHFTTSPPAQALVHVAVANLTDSLTSLSMALRPYQCSNQTIMRYTTGEMNAVGIVGMLMPLWMALGAIPFYGVAKLLLNDQKIALRLLQWYPLIPTMLLFLPTWNSIYPPLCLVTFWGLLHAVKAEKWRMALWAIFAGLVMSFTTFLNFAVLPMLLFFGVFTLGYALFISKKWLRAVIMGAWFGLGLATIWVLFWLASGFTPLDIFRVTYEAHKDLVQRNYWEWLLLHPYDTLFFVGLPIAGLFFWGIAKIRRVGKSDFSAHHLMGLSLLMTFLLVNLSGIVQGENGRILSFYAPFFLLAGGVVWTNQKRTWDLPLMGAQSLTVLIMAAVLSVVPLDLNPTPTAPRTDFYTMTGMEWLPVNAQFTSDAYLGNFTLVGHRYIPDPSQQNITIEIQWQGGAQVERPYQFEIVAYAENEIDGQIVSAPFTWYAQFENYLPTCWKNGETVLDINVIPLPEVSAPVIWRLELRAIDERTGDVMRVSLADGTQADRVVLAPVRYP
ncbi:MAG: hypothetical protein SFZ02_17500 [bacterium]|nr:hypothetical protein [bacterium]